MRRLIWHIRLLVLMTGILVLACTGPAERVAPTKVPAPGQETSTRPSGETGWEKTVAAARREGTVNLYTSMSVQMRAIMGELLKKSYGLELEMVSGRTTEVIAKINAERRAGLYLADVYIGGSSSQLQLKEAGLIRPIEPELMLPEVTDGKLWDGGQILYLDKDKLMLPFVSHVNLAVVINKELVNPPIKTFRELLEPKWKGKILMHDPTQSGSGNLFVLAVGELHGEEYIRLLAKQEPTLVRDYRTHMEWVARGKFPIGTGPSTENYAEFVRMGAPVAIPGLTDLNFVSTGVGMVSLLDKPAHPNATRVFINWLLSKEGQTAYARGMGDQSRRLDVTTEYAPPEMIRKPGVTYFNTETEELAQKRLSYQKLNQEIFGSLLK